MKKKFLFVLLFLILLTGCDTKSEPKEITDKDEEIPKA